MGNARGGGWLNPKGRRISSIVFEGRVELMPPTVSNHLSSRVSTARQGGMSITWAMHAVSMTSTSAAVQAVP
ncbi:hypothetical protein [Brevundimonas basaltis]|uniref:Uncharacterized protein n=1 Tax=Brevundimonas basaltis TaxID=472166 RepID=A0A7W8MGH4_9CAUL|nr:hypothetical protein [Brevundimonas basaltis]MBB5291945.1 hypothetical protein [Brevundimonas basaltis]